MIDFEDRLAETLERRAGRAPVAALAPTAVRQAIRRERARRATHGLAAVAACAGVAGVYAVVPGHHGTHRESAPVGNRPSSATTPTAPTTTPGEQVLAALSWTPGAQLTLRTGTGIEPQDHAAFCLSGSCTGIADLTGALDFEQTFGGVVGTAPVGTAKVRVAVTGATDVTTTVVPVRRNGVEEAVLFGVPAVSTQVGANPALTRTLLVQALDAKGQDLSERRSLGSVDLALEHPPVGVVQSLPAGTDDPLLAGTDDPLLWFSHSGWLCLGSRAAPGTSTAGAVYGASVCFPKSGPNPSLLSLSLEQPITHVIVSVPASTASAELRTSHATTKATLLGSGTPRVAVLNPPVSSQATGTAVLTVRNAQGHVVFSGSVDTLPYGEGVSAGSP